MSESLCVPHEPFLDEIFHHWKKYPEAKTVRDSSHTHQDVNISEFLYDVLVVRGRIWESLDDVAKKDLRSADADVFIALLANEEYSGLVLLFAIYALGAAIAPVCMSFLCSLLSIFEFPSLCQSTYPN